MLIPISRKLQFSLIPFKNLKNSSHLQIFASKISLKVLVETSIKQKKPCINYVPVRNQCLLSLRRIRIMIKMRKTKWMTMIEKLSEIYKEMRLFKNNKKLTETKKSSCNLLQKHTMKSIQRSNIIVDNSYRYPSQRGSYPDSFDDMPV